MFDNLKPRSAGSFYENQTSKHKKYVTYTSDCLRSLSLGVACPDSDILQATHQVNLDYILLWKKNNITQNNNHFHKREYQIYSTVIMVYKTFELMIKAAVPLASETKQSFWYQIAKSCSFSPKLYLNLINWQKEHHIPCQRLSVNF